MDAGPGGSRLHALQGGIAAQAIEAGPMDDSLAFFCLRDPAACADFAASRARTLIETGIPARDIGVMAGSAPRQLAVPPGEGTPDWEAILRGIQITPPEVMDPDRNLEGISLWSAQESPWRACAI